MISNEKMNMKEKIIISYKENVIIDDNLFFHIHFFIQNLSFFNLHENFMKFHSVEEISSEKVGI